MTELIKEVSLRGFLNRWKESDHCIEVIVNSKSSEIELRKREEDRNEQGKIIKAYFLKTILSTEMYYHDPVNFWKIEKGKKYSFFLVFEKAETLIFALEFFNKIKNAGISFDYYIFKNRGNKEEEENRYLNVEMLKICIYNDKKKYSCYINNYFDNVYDSILTKH